jgi:hypothetical protein
MRQTLWRGGLAMLAALVVLAVAARLTARPRLTRVVVVTAPVAAGAPVTPADWGWMTVAGSPPAGALTAPPDPGLLAQAPLWPGETLTAPVLGRTFGGLPRGRVRVVVPVTAAQSALVQVGSRVDVMAAIHTPAGAVAALAAAVHVPVIGVYNASGGPIVTTGSAAAAPALVALAVTPPQLQALLPLLTGAAGSGTTFWLVADPWHAVTAP